MPKHHLPCYAHSGSPPPAYSESSSSSTSRTQSPQTTYSCISLNLTDRIRLTRFPAHDIPLIENIIRHSWPKGMQSTRIHGSSYEIKMKGNPWSGVSWDKEKATSRKLVTGLFAGLYDMGWVLKASVDMSRKERDKDSLLFRHQYPAPPPLEWLSISFNSSSTLLLVSAPPELLRALGSAVRSEPATGTHEIRIAGAAETGHVALTLLEELEGCGFGIYAAVDQDIGGEMDTWHCCRVRGWRRGDAAWRA